LEREYCESQPDLYHFQATPSPLTTLISLLLRTSSVIAAKALSFYRRRDVVEKHCDDMKNALDMEKLRKTLVDTEIGIPKSNKKTWITKHSVPEVQQDKV